MREEKEQVYIVLCEAQMSGRNLTWTTDTAEVAIDLVRGYRVFALQEDGSWEKVERITVP